MQVQTGVTAPHSEYEANRQSLRKLLTNQLTIHTIHIRRLISKEPTNQVDTPI